MAEGYNADINLRVKIFDRELRRLERRIEQLDKISLNPRRTKESRAEAIVAEQRLQNLVKGVKAARDEAKAIQDRRRASVADFRQTVQLRKEARGVQERQLRLSNAQALQEQRLVALSRTNAQAVKTRAKAIEKLKKLSQDPDFAQDPRIQERVATSLGRILALQRQIDKSVTKQTAQQRRLSFYNKQIEELKRVGVSEGQLRKAIKRRAEFTDAFSRKQDDIAERREAQLKNEIKLLQDRNKEQLKAFRKTAPIQSSPVRGRVGIADSPAGIAARAKEAKRQLQNLAAEEERLNRFAASGRRLQAKAELEDLRRKKAELRDIERQEAQANKNARADRLFRERERRNQAAAEKKRLRDLNAEENRINKTLDDRRKLRERQRNAILKQDRDRQRAFGRGATNLATGVGFPLLFGGGPGAVLGGLAGGAAGGFGGSIFFSALGAQLDKAGQSAKALADNLNEPVALLDELSNTGFIVSDAVRQQVEALEEQGLVADAATAAVKALSEKIGIQGVNNIKAFDDASDKLRDRLATLSQLVFSELVPAINAAITGFTAFIDSLIGPDIQRQAFNLDPQAFAELQRRTGAEASA